MNDIQYPKNETVWLSHYLPGRQLAYIITSRKDTREWYYFYNVIDGKLRKMGKARTPPELIEKFAGDTNDARKTRNKISQKRT